jgi:hypothetical protein
METLENKFGWRYPVLSTTLNRFAGMLGSDKIFELPTDAKWTAPNIGNPEASII